LTKLLFKNRELLPLSKAIKQRSFWRRWNKVPVGSDLTQDQISHLRLIAKRAHRMRRAVILRGIAGGRVTYRLKVVVRRALLRNRRARRLIVIRNLVVGKGFTARQKWVLRNIARWAHPARSRVIRRCLRRGVATKSLKLVLRNYITAVFGRHRKVTIRRIRDAPLGTRLSARMKITLKILAFKASPAEKKVIRRCLQRGKITFRL
jgi:hypothetical protein